MSLSRSKLGPEPEVKPQHAIRYVTRDGNRSRAFCICGWSKKRSKKRSTPWIAREAVEAHIANEVVRRSMERAADRIRDKQAVVDVAHEAG